MKRLLVTLFVVAALATAVIAQSPVPFQHWPSLYAAAQHSVVKVGQDANGEDNGILYFRIGWGKCLGVYRSELDDLYLAAQQDRYINLRDYADTQLESDAWSAEHEANCPPPPLEVKPYWRGSRPTYEYVESEAGIWQKGDKSAYRILSPSPATATCTQYNARKDDGSQSNYWMVEDGTEVYIGEQTYLTGFEALGVRLLVVCGEQDVDILDYRF